MSSLRGAVQAVANNGGSGLNITTINNPGTSPGDVMLAWFFSHGVLTPPVGWTALKTGTEGAMNYGLYRKIAASEPGSYDFDQGAQIRAGLVLMAFSDPDGTTPTESDTAVQGTGTTFTIDGVTPGASDSVRLIFGFDDNDPNDVSSVTGSFTATGEVDITSNFTGVWGYKLLPGAPSAQGSVDINWLNSASGAKAQVIVRGAAGGGGGVSGVPLRVTLGLF